MRTAYETSQAEFSHKAHLAAQRDIYPPLFGTANIEYEGCDKWTGERNRILDGELGVDVIARPSEANTLNSRLHFYIQERFRRPGYAVYGDITITEFNHASQQPSELYKIAAGLMSYGLYDEERDRFTCAYVIDVSRTVLAIQRNKIRYRKERNKKQQSFIGLALRESRRPSGL